MFFNVTPLFYAVKHDNVEIVKLLLTRNDLNINKKYIFIKRF